jgi:hypothetical protein
VPADFWLVRLKNLHEKADTYLIFPHQIQQTQTGAVGECPKEQLLVEWFRRFTHAEGF